MLPSGGAHFLNTGFKLRNSQAFMNNDSYMILYERIAMDVNLDQLTKRVKS